MHLLTSSRPYRLRVEVQHRSTNLWYSAEYWSFKIGDGPNDKYRLDVAGYSGDAGDALQYEGDQNGNGAFGAFYNNGMKFTTYDRDNDKAVSEQCAAQQRFGGWWYNACMWACLTCIKDMFEWRTISVPGHLSNSRMMIKPQWKEKRDVRGRWILCSCFGVSVWQLFALAYVTCVQLGNSFMQYRKYTVLCIFSNCALMRAGWRKHKYM